MRKYLIVIAILITIVSCEKSASNINIDNTTPVEEGTAVKNNAVTLFDTILAQERKRAVSFSEFLFVQNLELRDSFTNTVINQTGDTITYEKALEPNIAPRLVGKYNVIPYRTSSSVVDSVEIFLDDSGLQVKVDSLNTIPVLIQSDVSFLLGNNYYVIGTFNEAGKAKNLVSINNLLIRK